MSGLDIPMIMISGKSDENKEKKKVKEAIVVLGRTHPG